MQKNRQIPVFWYAVIDVFMAALSWTFFYFIRKVLLHEPLTGRGDLQIGNSFWIGFLIIPPCWLMLYTLTGTYHSLYKKSRLYELTNTFISSLIGSIVLSFVLILNDTKDNYSYFYLAFISLLVLHFSLTFTGRLIILNAVKKQLLRGSVIFNTLMVGSRDNANRIYKETRKSQQDAGYRYAGFVTPDNDWPRSPTRESYPCGRRRMNSCACAARAAATISRRVASGLP